MPKTAPALTKIAATSVLASRHALDPSKRVDTIVAVLPRCLLAEFNTHRVFSRNAASSRAIPVWKLIQRVLRDPFVPMFCGKNQRGMQAGAEIKGWRVVVGRALWRAARYPAVGMAWTLSWLGFHKQLVNRLLEPWMWVKVVVTSTEWENFLALRDHEDAEPHMQVLAKAIRNALAGASPQLLAPGHWHWPFVEKADIDEEVTNGGGAGPLDFEMMTVLATKLSAARCASTSHKTVEGFDMTLDRAIAVHDKLVGAEPIHASPCEHQCRADEPLNPVARAGFVTDEWASPELSGNLGPGWVQYRKLLEKAG